MHKSLELGMRVLFVCAAVACGSESDGLFTDSKDRDLFADGGGASSGRGGISGESGSSGEGGSGAGSAAGGSSGDGGGGDPGSGGASGGADDAGTTDAGPDDGATSDGSTGGSAGVGSCATPVTYYADADKDGHGDPGVPLRSCSQPAGYVTSSDDCYDSNKHANPTQTGWFTVERGDGSYDYDCDGSGAPRFPAVGRCQSLAICMTTEGWQESVAACGAEKAWITGCTFPLCTPPITELRKQECH